MPYTPFPATIPAPLIKDYNVALVNNIIRTPFVNGRARQRKAFTSIPAFLVLLFVCNDTQAAAFESFADTIGADWFTISLKTPNGDFVTHTARFMETYDGPKLIGPDVWEYKAKVELENRL